jgi:hypothetical protein
MKKKALLLVSFALATVLVVGQAGIAAESDEKSPNQGMMNGNGMSGMMNMMQNENMGKMMDAMNSPEGQEMMNSCSNFMESYDGS